MYTSQKLLLRSIQANNTWLVAAMSSKKAAGKKAQKKSNDKEVKLPAEPSAVSLNQNGDILLKIHAKPGAKQNSITDIQPEAINVSIAAPPVDGEANAELTKYISKVLQLRKSDVSIDRGSKSREKTIIITKEAATDLNRTIDLLKSECENS